MKALKHWSHLSSSFFFLQQSQEKKMSPAWFIFFCGTVLNRVFFLFTEWERKQNKKRKKPTLLVWIYLNLHPNLKESSLICFFLDLSFCYRICFCLLFSLFVFFSAARVWIRKKKPVISMKKFGNCWWTLNKQKKLRKQNKQKKLDDVAEEIEGGEFKNRLEKKKHD